MNFDEEIAVTVFEYPFDDEDVLGWDKSTVKYITDKKSVIYKTMANIASHRGYILRPNEYDDIYSDVVLRAYTKADYSVEKAYVDGEIVPLEGYIFSMVKYALLKYVSGRADKSKNEQPDTIEADGEELSLFDFIEDKQSAQFEVSMSVSEACELAESHRYSCGVDIFCVLYATMLAKKMSLEDRLSGLFDALGIEQMSLSVVGALARKDVALTELVSAVTKEGIKSLDALRKYTYAADKIEAALTV